MEKFNRTLHGYDPIEVNDFLDRVIGQVEKMITEDRKKSARIVELEQLQEKYKTSQEKLEQYEKMEQTLNRAIFMAQKTSEQMKLNASKESELILDDAKRNANRIVNDALIKAEQTQNEAIMLKRNINVFKRRLRSALEQQLEMVDDIEKIDF